MNSGKQIASVDNDSKPLNIAILGLDKDCPANLINLGYEAGQLLAKRGWITMTGGVGGVFEAARKGALDAGGLSLAVTEAANKGNIQHYSALLPVSSTSLKRLLVVESADAAILIGGWMGTLDLMVQMASQKKPVFAISGTGGVADVFGGKSLIPPNGPVVILVESIEQALWQLQKVN